MGRSVQAEEHIGSHFDDLLQLRIQAEVGILIGKQSIGARDLLLSSIRTPLQDGCEPVRCSTSRAPPKGGKAGKPAPKSAGSVSVQLQEDWIIEHARQVARMLPGGVSVVGLYLFASEAGFQSALNQLCSLLNVLWSTQAPPPDAEGGSGELLLLHYDNGTKRTAIKSAAGPSVTTSGLKVGEIKFTSVFSNLVTLTCRHSVQLAVPTTTPPAQVHQEAALALAREGDRISRALTIVGGALRPAASDSAPLVDTLPKEASTATAAALPSVAVELLLPLPCSSVTAGQSSSSSSTAVGLVVPSSVSAGGLVTVAGEVVGVSYAHKREPLGRALADLKADLERSLKVRLDLLVEDALRGEEEDADKARRAAQLEAPGAQQPPGSSASVTAAAAPVPVRTPSHPLLKAGAGAGGAAAVALPRRVLLPWRGGLQLCDYLLPDETAESALERAEELLDLHISDATMVSEPELPAPSPSTPGPWQPTSDAGAQALGELPGMFAQQGGAASAAEALQALAGPLKAAYPFLPAIFAALLVLVAAWISWLINAASEQ